MCARFRVLVCENEWAFTWGWNELFEAEYMALLGEKFKNGLGELSWESGI